MIATHIPVMAQEVCAYLAPGPEAVFLDCTLGGGGHGQALLEASGPSGVLVGLDRDGGAIDYARERLASYGKRALLVQDNFVNLKKVLAGLRISRVDGVLFDLGASSLQLKDPGRGFSFSEPGPLDMRMDRRGGVSAEELVNELPEGELVALIRRYGEERFARRIARTIAARRPFRGTVELAEAVASAIPRKSWPPGRHPATRTFQALRIAVNEELGVLRSSLLDAIDVLKAGGRLCVIAFHSLEDRIVKKTLAEEARSCRCPPEMLRCECGGARVKLLTRKPVRPSAEELLLNPRARSARLRAAERC